MKRLPCARPTKPRFGTTMETCVKKVNNVVFIYLISQNSELGMTSITFIVVLELQLCASTQAAMSQTWIDRWWRGNI